MCLDEQKTLNSNSNNAIEQQDAYNLREYLINRIFDMGDILNLRNITLQTAVIYIEKLLHNRKHEIIEKDKLLWAITGLLLASKYIELDDNIPFIKDFRKIANNK